MSSAESVPGTWRRLHENSLAPVVVRRGPTYGSLASDASFRVSFL